MIRKITTFASNVTALKHLSMGSRNLIWNILLPFSPFRNKSGDRFLFSLVCIIVHLYKFGLSNLPYWLKQKIQFRPVRVDVITIDDLHVGPPLVSDHLSTTRNFSQSKPYTWNLSYAATSCKRSRPAFLGCRFNDFPLHAVFNLL